GAARSAPRRSEAGALEPRRREADLGRAGHARPRLGNVLHVPVPRGLGTERREDDGERPPRALARHLDERLVKERMPVTHPDEDRQRGAPPSERLLETARLSERQLGEWRAAAPHLLLVGRDLLPPLP